MIDELKPCPFCGSGDIYIKIHTPYRERPLYHGECFTCGTTTAFADTESGAAHNWNNRPAYTQLAAKLAQQAEQVAQLTASLAASRQELERSRAALADISGWLDANDYEPEEEFSDSDTVDALKAR